MGSFNETCALSSFPICVGDPVNLLFLTRNPYVDSDRHEAQRGVKHYDQWVLRTPPIKGKYADYGDCEFKHDDISRLVEQVFSIGYNKVCRRAWNWEFPKELTLRRM